MKRPILVIISILILTFTMITSVSAAESKGTVLVTKTFQLDQAAKTIQFTLEGTDGSFTAVMVMPDGHNVSSTKTTKIITGNQAVWRSVFTVKSAVKGKYTFKINAPKDSYYNLQVHIPLFSDIASHWAENAINDFVQKGIVNGYANGQFQPDAAVNGEAFVKMAVLALTEENPSGKRQWAKSFRWKVTDQSLSQELGYQEFDFKAPSGVAWSKPYLEAAKQLGFTSDWTDEQLTNPLTRKDVALMLANIISLTKITEVKAASYSDISQLDLKYKKAIDLVSNFAIFTGYPDGTFLPNKIVSRAESVKVLSVMVDYLN